MKTKSLSLIILFSLTSCCLLLLLFVFPFQHHQIVDDGTAVAALTAVTTHSATTTNTRPTNKEKKQLAQRPRQPRFAIVTVASKIQSHRKEYSAQSTSARFLNETFDAALRNKLLYTALHGDDCDLFVASDSSCSAYSVAGAHPSYRKFHIALHLVKQQRYDWILVVDHDAIFAQLGTSIESLLRHQIFPDEKDFGVFAEEKYEETAHSKDMIISSDWNGINSGVMFVRGKGARWPEIFFKILINPPRECRHSGLFFEQSVLKCVLDKPMSAPDRWKIKFVSPQHVINAYPSPYHFDHEDSKFEQGRDFIAHFAGASGLATINAEKYPIDSAIKAFHKVCDDSIADVKNKQQSENDSHSRSRIDDAEKIVDDVLLSRKVSGKFSLAARDENIGDDRQPNREKMIMMMMSVEEVKLC
jgi:hypothetical protein